MYSYFPTHNTHTTPRLTFPYLFLPLLTLSYSYNHFPFFPLTFPNTLFFSFVFQLSTSSHPKTHLVALTRLHAHPSEQLSPALHLSIKTPRDTEAIVSQSSVSTSSLVDPALLPSGFALANNTMGRTVDQEVHAAFVEFRAKEDDKVRKQQLPNTLGKKIICRKMSSIYINTC